MNLGVRSEFFPWQPAAALRVTGDDSATFLQGQITNDLHKAAVGEAVYGLWLNQKGKVLADSFVQPVGPRDFRIVSYFSPAAVIRERLEAYVVADDVVIEDLTDRVEGLTIFGDAAAVREVPMGGWKFGGRRSRAPQVEVVAPSGSLAPLVAGLAGAMALGPGEMERRRIAAGIPAVPADLGPTDLPNEGGLEAEAISYTKGCYLGQEVMARLKTMGQVRRRLVRVRGEGATPPAPAELFQAGRKVGELRSVAADGAGWIGLALVVLLQVKRTEALALAADGPANVAVVDAS